MKGQVVLSQFDFLKKHYNEVPKCTKGGYCNTLVPANLFKQSSNNKALDPEKKQEYRKITAKTLWLSQRSQPDIQLATGYHCTKVTRPTKQDWKKLTWLMQYLWKTHFIPLIIEITEKGAIIYIDDAHAVHYDAKGHSGLFLTQGKGVMINLSKKLGIVTTSSIETEMVSTGERLPKCTWF